MVSTDDTGPRCHNCGGSVSGSEAVCPHCQFDPRDSGLRIAIGLLIGAVTAIALAMASISIAPTAGTYLVVGGFLLLALAGIAFLLAFLVTPSRFSTLFRVE